MPKLGVCGTCGVERFVDCVECLRKQFALEHLAAYGVWSDQYREAPNRKQIIYEKLIRRLQIDAGLVIED